MLILDSKYFVYQNLNDVLIWDESILQTESLI
jgi:hypothetical protein